MRAPRSLPLSFGAALGPLIIGRFLLKRTVIKSLHFLRKVDHSSAIGSAQVEKLL